MSNGPPVRVGFQPDPGSDLERLGRELLKAAMAYRQEFAKWNMLSAVVWASYPSGQLVIVTRGEYRDLIMENIESIGREPGG